MVNKVLKALIDTILEYADKASQIIHLESLYYLVTTLLYMILFFLPIEVAFMVVTADTHVGALGFFVVSIATLLNYPWARFMDDWRKKVKGAEQSD